MKTTGTLAYVPSARDVFGGFVVREERARNLALPDLKTMGVFENRDGKWLRLAVLENDASVSQPPFDAIAFSLTNLWAE